MKRKIKLKHKVLVSHLSESTVQRECDSGNVKHKWTNKIEVSGL
jgi:hypothetical protein